MTNDTRQRIRSAALSAFCEHGYGVGVDEIARRAGVVKQTLYHHYGSKDLLFSEALEALADEFLVDLQRRSASLRQDLLRIGQAYRAAMLSEFGLALHRMMVTEAQRFPELARSLYEAGCEPVSQGLTALLKDAMERGELRHALPEAAADILLSLLAGQERNQRLYGVRTKVDRGADRVEEVVDFFLRAYSPEPDAGRVKGMK